MSDNKACCKRNAEGDHRLLSSSGKCLCNGSKDNETGIAEDRDGNQETCESKSFLFFSFSEDLQECVRHSLGCAGHLEDLAHHNAEADDDTDASQCAAKARCDRVDDTKCFSVLKCDVEQRHSAYNTDDYCTDDQRQKCLDLGLKNHEDKANNTDCKTDQHSLSA